MRCLLAALLITTTAPAGDSVWQSPFGVGGSHVNGRTVKDSRRWLPAMAAIGLREVRSPALNWGALEREPGVWDWSRLDEQVAYFESLGLRGNGTLIGNPAWNGWDAPGTLPVNNLVGWSEYVGRTVGHLRGRVRAYEVWNEPPNFTGKDQTPADYAAVVRAAHDAAKEADPDCLIGMAAKSAHVTYLQQAIRGGAKGRYDYVTLHPYECLSNVARGAGTEPVFLNVVPALRAMLAESDPEKRDVPVVFTELGVKASKGLGVQSAGLVKAYAMSLAQGVSCVHWFEGRDGDSGPMGLLDREGKPRPAYRAMASLIEYLGQSPAYVGWVALGGSGGHYAFVFEGAEGPVAAAWTPLPGGDAVRLPAAVRVIDPAGDRDERAAAFTLSDRPLLLIGLPESVVAAAKSNRGRRTPWVGDDGPDDYSEAEAVSIEFGETTTERGLHSLAGDAVAEAVLAYGGSARSGGVPGGTAFAVDPAFLTFGGGPVEITVEVRRNEANDNAGFKLVYESPKGFSTAGGWYTVPDNTQWHTKTFRIEDPQFVGYWGYHFNLVSDGDVYNRYLIRRVEVRKVGGTKAQN